ncbi:hypothetical protein M758_UG124500 [Ceratodon purpureus]|nr:hypothetical protein M758_UG124500 [Ceratodon purpureus]
MMFCYPLGPGKGTVGANTARWQSEVRECLMIVASAAGMNLCGRLQTIVPIQIGIVQIEMEQLHAHITTFWAVEELIVSNMIFLFYSKIEIRQYVHKKYGADEDGRWYRQKELAPNCPS